MYTTRRTIPSIVSLSLAGLLVHPATASAARPRPIAPLARQATDHADRWKGQRRAFHDLRAWRRVEPRVDRIYRQEARGWTVNAARSAVALAFGSAVAGSLRLWQDFVTHHPTLDSRAMFYLVAAGVAFAGVGYLDRQHQDRVQRTVTRALRDWNRAGPDRGDTLIPPPALLRALGPERRQQIAEDLLDEDMQVPDVILRDLSHGGLSIEHQDRLRRLDE